MKKYSCETTSGHRFEIEAENYKEAWVTALRRAGVPDGGLDEAARQQSPVRHVFLIGPATPTAPEVITSPTAHYFESTGEAYDASQTQDEIKNGDVLVVPHDTTNGPIVVGILVEAWPVAIGDQAGNFHTPKDGSWDWSRVDRVGGRGAPYDMTASLELARAELAKLVAGTEPAEGDYFWVKKFRTEDAAARDVNLLDALRAVGLTFIVFDENGPHLPGREVDDRADRTHAGRKPGRVVTAHPFTFDDTELSLIRQDVYDRYPPGRERVAFLTAFELDIEPHDWQDVDDDPVLIDEAEQVELDALEPDDPPPVKTRFWSSDEGSSTCVQWRDDTDPPVWLHTNLGWVQVNVDAPHVADEAFAVTLAEGYGLTERSEEYARGMLGGEED